MRAIDADELLAEYDRHHKGPAGGARKLIEDAPTIRAIHPEITRCKECLYRKICSWEKQGAKFCSFAERREVTT